MFSHINQPAQRSDVSWRLARTKKAPRERKRRGREKSGRGKEEFVPQRISDGGGWPTIPDIRPVKLPLISIASVHREVRAALFYSREESRALVNRSFLAPGVEIRFHVLLPTLCTIGNRRVHYTRLCARPLLLPSKEREI